MKLEPIVRCLECGGISTLQAKHRLVISMTERNGAHYNVVRISEEWRCHNGHLRMKNYNEEEPVVLRTT